MKVTKSFSTQNVFDIELSKGNSHLTIMYGGTLDLYWILKVNDLDKDTNHLSFEIDKENYKLYESFENLFSRIEILDIYEDELLPSYITNYKKYEDYQKEKRELYEKYNLGNYFELFNKKEKTVTWYSDETAHEVANYVVITKYDSTFKLDFYTQPYIKGYEREQNRKGVISIRFRNSGSRYKPFNAIFMRMFNELQSIDDIRDEGHQIHIEEFLICNKKESRN